MRPPQIVVNPKRTTITDATVIVVTDDADREVVTWFVDAPPMGPDEIGLVARNVARVAAAETKARIAALAEASSTETAAAEEGSETEGAASPPVAAPQSAADFGLVGMAAVVRGGLYRYDTNKKLGRPLDQLGLYRCDGLRRSDGDKAIVKGLMTWLSGPKRPRKRDTRDPWWTSTRENTFFRYWHEEGVLPATLIDFRKESY